MRTENWEQIKDILRDVLEISPSKRRIFLEQNEIKPEIRVEVESLLAFESEVKDFMSLPISDFSKDLITKDLETEISLVGQQIGVYEIIGELGFGGMGAVYLGTRADGKFEQKVAIKMLKREYNIEKIRRHFEIEKEILATLVHPNIASLLDAGTTADGVPFIVMEFVAGEQIDKFCQNRRLSLTGRLKLFNKVCAAVGFAHRNLVVHRDLKPSNILVTANGEPKLLDFGISKLLGTERTEEKTAITILGAMTPEYASPEQIKGEQVTTATDIYSLGVVLYKILTDSLPFQSKTNGELLKSITEDEPTAPSKTELTAPTKDSDLAQLKGDLDNIILKSLNKEPERRYKTVEQFSGDIWRYLDGLPVTARPATFGYRASKFIQRNKISVVAAVLIFLSLITGVAVALWQAREARAQANLAIESQRKSELETEKAKEEQRKSEKVTKFVSKIFDYANPGWFAEGAKTEGNARMIDVVEELSDKIDTEFANEADVAAELHATFAGVFHWVSKKAPDEQRQMYQQKRRYHALRALELRKQFYGERHELVARDMFGSYGFIGTTQEEHAKALMEAILMMRETNPQNLNFAYMFEAYAAHLMLPEFESLHEPYRNAVIPPTDENKYQIAERMLREALPVWHLHYKPDHGVILAKECWLAYALAKQKKWMDFDEHYRICKQGETGSVFTKNSEETLILDLIEQMLAAEKGESSK